MKFSYIYTIASLKCSCLLNKTETNHPYYIQHTRVTIIGLKIGKTFRFPLPSSIFLPCLTHVFHKLGVTRVQCIFK